MSDSGKIHVTVAIATCGRPEGLRATLASVAAQYLANPETIVVDVAVVDNHRDASARPTVEEMVKDFPFPMTYEAEAQPGISFARNHLVRMAEGSDYIAFIDDDEVAAPQWLSELLRVALEDGTPVVLGPVLPSLQGKHAEWMKPLYERPRHPDASAATTADFRTGNLLMKLDIIAAFEGPFHHAFALIGGSDSLLGFQLTRAGHRFSWADHAAVTETMPADRVQPRWYLRRRYRSGFVYARVQQEILGRPRGTARGLYRGVGTVARGTMTTVRALPQGRLNLLRALGDVAYGAGSIAGIFGRIRAEYAGRSES